MSYEMRWATIFVFFVCVGLWCVDALAYVWMFNRDIEFRSPNYLYFCCNNFVLTAFVWGLNIVIIVVLFVQRCFCLNLFWCLFVGLMTGVAYICHLVICMPDFPHPSCAESRYSIYVFFFK